MPDNAFDGSQHIWDGLAETNPHAEKSNAIQLLGITRYGGTYATGFSITVTNAGDDVAFAGTAGHQTPTPRFFKWVIRDGNGTEAFGALDTVAPTAPVAVDTSGLDPTTDWTIEFNAEKETGEYVGYHVVLPAGSVLGNPVLTVTDGQFV